ncbi:MAG: hypothetical protein OER92_11260, partial [Alphaproteobacteria bacterium]|nr:hypothetical protein [Alphaproteobacteria bacterium]
MDQVPDQSADHASTLTGLQRALRGRRTAGGLDLGYTKLAIDLQNLATEQPEDDLRRHIASLQDSLDCDAVAVALFDEEGQTIDRVFAASATFSPCNPEVLQGEALSDWPWLDASLAHLRLIGIADSGAPNPAQQTDADALAALKVGAILLVGFESRGKRA